MLSALPKPDKTGTYRVAEGHTVRPTTIANTWIVFWSDGSPLLQCDCRIRVFSSPEAALEAITQGTRKHLPRRPS